MTTEVTTPHAEPPKEMSLAEFRELGYLQELNRQFLHPLGLALAVERKTGAVKIWDGRDDPEGFVFTGGFSTEERRRALYVAGERLTRATHRIKTLGFAEQPL